MRVVLCTCPKEESEALAEKLIKRSIEIYSGGLDLEDYQYLLNKK